MTAEYNLSDELRKKMYENEPIIKAAICTIANERFGIKDKPMGIFECGGGVLVNNKEIVIKENYVKDDWNRNASNNRFPEEVAVVEAIEEVSKIISEDNGVENLEKKYGSCKFGNRLRCLIGEF